MYRYRENSLDSCLQFDRWCACCTAAILVIGIFAVGCTKESDESDSTRADAPAPATSSTAASDIPRDKLEASLDAAQQYIDNDELYKAETILHKVIEKSPSTMEAHEMLARAVFRKASLAKEGGNVVGGRKLYREAYDHYARAASLSPDIAGLQQNAGEFAVAAHLPIKALQHFSEARTLDPTNLKHPLYEAQMLLQENRIDEAEESIAAVLALDPNQPYGLATSASIYMERGEKIRALDTIRQARELATINEEDLAFRTMEARFLRLMDQPQKSLELLLPLDFETRTTSGVTYEIALAQLAMDRPGKALAAWDDRYRTTHDWEAARGAAEACLAGGNIGDAWMWFRRAELSAPPDDEAMVGLEEKLKSAGE